MEFNSIDFSHSSHKAWRIIKTNLLAGLDAPLGKFHHLAIGEERGTQDQQLRAQQARQQTAV